MILNLPTVKFWTIDNNYIPCTKNLEDKPGADSPNGYIVGILNNEKYEECKRIYPSSGEVYYSYDHFDEKMHWRNSSGALIDDDISSYIDPRCHVLVDLDRFGAPNWAYNDISAQRYYRTLMSSSALGVTTPAQSVGNTSGLMSFNPPDEEVFVHELAHLCGLSDAEKLNNNLMYKNKSGGTLLGNIPLDVSLCGKDANGNDRKGSGMERQWDCLHDGKYADGCFDKAYRLLNF